MCLGLPDKTVFSILRRSLFRRPDGWLELPTRSAVTASSATSSTASASPPSGISWMLVLNIPDSAPLDELDELEDAMMLSDLVREGLGMRKDLRIGLSYRCSKVTAGRASSGRPSGWRSLSAMRVLTKRRGGAWEEGKEVGKDAARRRSPVAESGWAGRTGTVASDIALRRPTAGRMRWTW